MNFLFILMLIMLIGGAGFFGFEFGYESGYRHARQTQGYKFQKATPAFAEMK